MQRLESILCSSELFAKIFHFIKGVILSAYLGVRVVRMMCFLLLDPFRHQDNTLYKPTNSALSISQSDKKFFINNLTCVIHFLAQKYNWNVVFKLDESQTKQRSPLYILPISFMSRLHYSFNYILIYECSENNENTRVRTRILGLRCHFLYMATWVAIRGCSYITSSKHDIR